MKRLAIIKVIIAAVLLVFSVNAMGQLGAGISKISKATGKAVSATSQITSRLVTRHPLRFPRVAYGAASYSTKARDVPTERTVLAPELYHPNPPKHQLEFPRTIISTDKLSINELDKAFSQTRLLLSTSIEQLHFNGTENKENGINSSTEEIDEDNNIEDNVEEKVIEPEKTLEEEMEQEYQKFPWWFQLYDIIEKTTSYIYYEPFLYGQHEAA